jgi:hypothetical protein
MEVERGEASRVSAAVVGSAIPMQQDGDHTAGASPVAPVDQQKETAIGEEAVQGQDAGQPVIDANNVKVEQDDAALVEATTKSCHAVIESIRRDEFGLGLELEGVGGRLREVQNARMGRALQRLSAELYSRDTHFVLELVQNAGKNELLGMLVGCILSGHVARRAALVSSSIC